jgi:hypothetical protein
VGVSRNEPHCDLEARVLPRSLVRMVNSREVRWAGHVEMHAQVSWRDL